MQLREMRLGFGRHYAKPMVFRSVGDVDLAMMGQAVDVQAVGLTYEGDHDGVSRHVTFSSFSYLAKTTCCFE